MRTPLILSLAATLLAGCGPSIHMEVMRPADVSIPGHVQKLALVDRSAPANTGQAVLGTLEGLVTGESILEDRDGAAAAMNGLTTYLADSPRYEVAQVSISKETAESNLWDKELSWRAAKRIAKMADADAVVSLEAFDSDSYTDVTSSVREESTPSGGTARTTVFHAQRETRVIAAWRVYDVENKVILDDLRDHPTARTWEEDGDSRTDAMAQLPSRRDTVMDLGYVSGEWYARRIAPTYIWVSRGYYGKGDPRLKDAKNYVKASDWQGAMEIWEGLLGNPDPKLRGKAEYNMAVALEVAGDLQGALSFAKKAAVSLPKGRTRDYVRTLKGRVRDQARLEEQLAPPPPKSDGHPQHPEGRPLAVPDEEPPPEGTMTRPR